MATFHQRAPGDLHDETRDLHRGGSSVWRWLFVLTLGLLALWGLFGRRDHRPAIDMDAREPTRVPYENSR
jgi:hypothetical protein